MTARSLARTVPTTSSVATRCLRSTACTRTATGGRFSAYGSCLRPQPASASVTSSAARIDWPGFISFASTGLRRATTPFLPAHTDPAEDHLQRAEVGEGRLQEVEPYKRGKPEPVRAVVMREQEA